MNEDDVIEALTPSYQYRFRTLAPTQTRPREHRLVFLGWDDDWDLIFSPYSAGEKAEQFIFSPSEITEIVFSPHGEPYQGKIIR